jgi:hypothetical protein
MATDIENSSISFTEEAEVTLKRQVSRYERKIRAFALEAAVRSRGLPAEVTGSDVIRATGKLNERFLPEIRRHGRYIYRDESGISSENMVRVPYLDRGGIKRGKLPLERVAHLYAWLGAVGTIVGLVWAPAYHAVRMLSADPAWRIGFIVAEFSFAMFVSGIAVKFYVTKVRALRRPPNVQEK